MRRALRRVGCRWQWNHHLWGAEEGSHEASPKGRIAASSAWAERISRAPHVLRFSSHGGEKVHRPLATVWRGSRRVGRTRREVRLAAARRLQLACACCACVCVSCVYGTSACDVYIVFRDVKSIEMRGRWAGRRQRECCPVFDASHITHITRTRRTRVYKRYKYEIANEIYRTVRDGTLYRIGPTDAEMRKPRSGDRSSYPLPVG